MTKTAPLTDDTHKYLKWLQAVLYNKYDIDMHIRDIIDCIVKDDNIRDAENVAKKIAKVDMKNEKTIIINSEGIYEK